MKSPIRKTVATELVTRGEFQNLRSEETTTMAASPEQSATDPTVAGSGDLASAKSSAIPPKIRTTSNTITVSSKRSRHGALGWTFWVSLSHMLFLSCVFLLALRRYWSQLCQYLWQLVDSSQIENTIQIGQGADSISSAIPLIFTLVLWNSIALATIQFQLGRVEKQLQNGEEQ